MASLRITTNERGEHILDYEDEVLSASTSFKPDVESIWLALHDMMKMIEHRRP